MELLKIKIPTSSGVFNNPLSTWLAVIGFAKNWSDAIHKIRDGKVKVNKEVMTDPAYVVQSGDMIEVDENAIVLEEG